ncbi:hypothetical protein BH24ACT3_BH24ACT3_03130 [soil metagenome]
MRAGSDAARHRRPAPRRGACRRCRSVTTAARTIERAVERGLGRRVPEPFLEALDRWRCTTTLTRLESVDGTASAARLKIVDDGPGRVWSIEADPQGRGDVLADEDPGLVVRPVAAAARCVRTWWDTAVN